MRAGDKRGEVMEWRGATLINDCYNSNPRALDAMVDALLAIPAERHVVVAGEMLELGMDAEVLHAACGRRMGELGVVVVGVRGAAEALVEAAKKAGGGGGVCAGCCCGGGVDDWKYTGGRCGAVESLARRELEKALAVIAENSL